MKKIITILLLISTYVVQAQSKKIDQCIKAISNKDFIIDHEKKQVLKLKISPPKN